jgi:Zn-dependent peptidase ImmA (M78 family)
MITTLRKKVINDLANTISATFYSKNLTDLEAAASDEEIFYYYDHFENSFDGLLVYDHQRFHIHINEDRGNTKGSKRGRFSFAHELGHYFIDEHRIGLKNGLLKPHGSIHEPNQKDLIEIEADYFAGCLLMPDYRFRKRFNCIKFSLETILNLAKEFQASVLATVLRFAEIGTHSIMAVVSENNIIKWYSKSDDFPKWPFKFKVGNKLPPSTVAGEFFTRQDSKYTGIENVDPEDWFYPAWIPKTPMHEQCYYSDGYGYVISIIWFD